MAWIYVSATYFTVRMEVDERGYVTETAAICKWCKGKHKDYVRQYYKNKGVLLEWKEFK